MADHGKGFCVYNNVVVAARHAQRSHGVGKALIVDWDVHHGNGTQDAFWRDPSVLFVSLHQDNLFPPDWGAVDQVGEGEGRGFTVNIPLPAGTGNVGYLAAFDRIVAPIARQFAPELIFISAGQDANVMDPLARMCVTLDGFRGMMRRMQAVADECCDGRIVITQEGGYAAAYAPYCSAAVAETLVGLEPGAAPIADPYGPRADSLPPSREMGLDCERAIDRILETQRTFWRV
jgi:acetoin utilization deacetylase AcuC-like enzyme